MSILITILALAFVILIHEFGHMIVAKRAGVGVYEFSLGMGPKIFGKTIGGTLYTLRLLPLGGFVKLAGMDDEQSDSPPPAELNFYNKSWGRRFSVIAAGPVFNILLGFFIFVGIYTLMGVPHTQPVLHKIAQDSPAMKGGLLPGDRILTVNEIPVRSVEDDLIPAIHNSTHLPLVFELKRGADILNITVIPEALDGGKQGLIGVVFETQWERLSPLAALSASIDATEHNVGLVFKSLTMLITGKAGLKELAGPVGIVQITSYQLQRSIAAFFGMVAMISISLGVANLLPIPVLDGGHILFLIIEALRKKPLNKLWENRINTAAYVVLMALMALIVINDVVNWSSRIALLKKL
ncbi:MAG: RIP metalloprotease RseP [Candidatus Margulisiibacteriota bacterium]